MVRVYLSAAKMYLLSGVIRVEFGSNHVLLLLSFGKSGEAPETFTWRMASDPLNTTTVDMTAVTVGASRTINSSHMHEEVCDLQQLQKNSHSTVITASLLVAVPTEFVT